MKMLEGVKYVGIALILMAFIGCSTGSNIKYHPSKKTRYYDESGRYQGYSIDTGYSTRYYSKDGRYVGNSK
jgi:hypothetical protein